jgi:5S rRNA maturation endonuclease (ribonuclease M5)
MTIVDFCHDYGIQYRVEAEGWINIECPLCRHSGTRGFKGGINIAGKFYHCWNCGGHSLNEVLSALLGITNKRANEILIQYGSDSSFIRRKKANTETVDHVELPFDYFNDTAKKYLISRRFDPDEIAEKYKVVGCSIVGPWAYRLIIPIYLDNKLVAFQGRLLFSKKLCGKMEILRYKNLSLKRCIKDPKTILYNIDNCHGKRVILVEGVFDVWRLGDGVCATFGTSVSGEQIDLIAERFSSVVLMFDPEKGALEMANKLALQLSGRHIEVSFINTELEHDPGDYADDELKMIKEALKL